MICVELSCWFYKITIHLKKGLPGEGLRGHVGPIGPPGMKGTVLECTVDQNDYFLASSHEKNLYCFTQIQNLV